MKNKKTIGLIIVILVYLSMFLYFFIRIFDLERQFSIKGIYTESLILIIWGILPLCVSIIEFLKTKKIKNYITKKSYINNLLDCVLYLIYSMFMFWLASTDYYVYSHIFVVTATSIIFSSIVIILIKEFINKRKKNDENN